MVSRHNGNLKLPLQVNLYPLGTYFTHFTQNRAQKHFPLLHCLPVPIHKCTVYQTTLFPSMCDEGMLHLLCLSLWTDPLCLGTVTPAGLFSSLAGHSCTFRLALNFNPILSMDQRSDR